MKSLTAVCLTNLSSTVKRMTFREVSCGNFTASQIEALLEMPVGTSKVFQVLKERESVPF